jgi:hypothetical protein
LNALGVAFDQIQNELGQRASVDLSVLQAKCHPVPPEAIDRALGTMALYGQVGVETNGLLSDNYSSPSCCLANDSPLRFVPKARASGEILVGTRRAVLEHALPPIDGGGQPLLPLFALVPNAPGIEKDNQEEHAHPHPAHDAQIRELSHEDCHEPERDGQADAPATAS